MGGYQPRGISVRKSFLDIRIETADESTPVIDQSQTQLNIERSSGWNPVDRSTHLRAISLTRLNIRWR